MHIPTLGRSSCATPLFYSLPATKLGEGMSTEDGQDILRVQPDDDVVFATVYTPRSDDAEQDEENRAGPETRMYDVDERVGLAVFRDTEAHGLNDPDAVILPPEPDDDEPIHVWADADGAWIARVTLRPGFTVHDLRADADRIRLRVVDAIRQEGGGEPDPVPAGTDERDGQVVTITYRAADGTQGHSVSPDRPDTEETPA